MFKVNVSACLSNNKKNLLYACVCETKQMVSHSQNTAYFYYRSKTPQGSFNSDCYHYPRTLLGIRTCSELQRVTQNESFSTQCHFTRPQWKAGRPQGKQWWTCYSRNEDEKGAGKYASVPPQFKVFHHLLGFFAFQWDILNQWWKLSRMDEWTRGLYESCRGRHMVRRAHLRLDVTQGLLNLPESQESTLRKWALYLCYCRSWLWKTSVWPEA